MTASHPHQTPVVAFLGSDAGRGGPFALLGLFHEIQSDEQIYQACNRRLQQVDCSRYRSTPDAEEVRLAVHSAASQLLDPNLRKQLAMRWPPGVPASVPKAWKRSSSSTTLTPRLLHNAKLLIAGSGGWNPLARKRLAHFARVNRLSAIDIVNALIPKRKSTPGGSQSSPSGLAATHQQHLQSSLHLPRNSSIDTSPTKSSAWMISYLILCVVAVSIVSSFIYSSRTANTIPQPIAENNPSHSNTQDQNQQQQNANSISTPRESLDHYTAIAHELNKLVTRFDVDPSASMERFPFVYKAYTANWLQFPPKALERSSLHIAELVKLIAIKHQAFEWEPLFAQGSPQDPLIDAIHAATLDVVLSDMDLPLQTRSDFLKIRSQYPGVPVHSRSDVVGSLGLILGLLGVEQSQDNVQWWKRWIEGVHGTHPDQRSHLVLSALSARLHDSTPSNKQWERSAIELVQAVSWNNQTTREWLLRQFADETVQTSRLAAVTVAIAVHSGAEHVDATMVLNPSSTFIQRQPMADRYRSAWGGDQTASTMSLPTTTQTVSNELRIRITSTPVTTNRKQAIQNLVDLTQYNSIAWEINFGDQLIAIELASAVSLTRFNTINASGFSLLQTTQDTHWAQQAINATGIESLTLLCSQLDPLNLGPNSASALVHLATVHADSDIRALATIHLLRMTDHPAMLLALDHAAGGRRITSRLASVIEQIVGHDLPKRNDEQWFFVVHQRLLLKLANALAQSKDAELTNLEYMLAVVYDQNQPTIPTNRSALGGLESRFQILEEQFYSRTIDPTLQSQHTSMRASLNLAMSSAPSTLHQFAANQASFAKLLGIITQQHFPGSVYRVREIEHDLESRLANVDTLIDQMVQYERASAELFVIWLSSQQIGGASDE